ncbi:hypothetical protein B296_00033946 [Ensete ventricosum]|uniref:Uncharacterized protein n=1 Tax=Ensete ventricosum TaxID=4639 RepID=A0A426X9P8_ENSVE|nr:hypothetical protein B296_00033946 [Ensete ventricosum]
MALYSDSSAASTSAPLPSGSSNLSALATASIVLTQPLNGSLLSTSSDSNVLGPSKVRCTGPYQHTEIWPVRYGMFAAAQRHSRGELLQKRQARRHQLLGLPPRAVEDEKDGGRAGRIGGEEAEVPASGEEEDGQGGISPVAVVEESRRGWEPRRRRLPDRVWQRRRQRARRGRGLGEVHGVIRSDP